MSNFDNGEVFAGSFLSHFGVKGMKWGRRKDKGGGSDSSSSSSKKDNDPDSDDFVRTAGIAVKAKTSGVRSLSNRELRDLVDRINLEQNFKRVTTPEAKQSSPFKTGVTYISNKIKKTGDMTVDQLLKTAVQVNVEQYKGNLKIPGKK